MEYTWFTTTQKPMSIAMPMERPLTKEEEEVLAGDETILIGPAPDEITVGSLIRRIRAMREALAYQRPFGERYLPYDSFRGHPHAEVYWSEPNEMWVVQRVKSGKVEAHEWVDGAERIGDAVRRLLSW